MTLSRLKWLCVVAPAVFFTAIEIARHLLLDGVLDFWAGSPLLLVVVCIAAFFFSRRVFENIEGMQREIVRRNEELSARNAVGVAVSQAPHLDEALGRALEAVLQITGAEAGEILVLEQGSRELTLRAHRGIASDVFQQITRFRFGEGLPGLVAQSGEPLLSSNLPDDPRFLREGVKAWGFRSFAGVPLKSKNQVVGVMDVASLDSRRFSPHSLELLIAIGNQIGVAIENARLLERMRYMAILEERDRIGREIHDSLAQTLGYLNMQSRAIEALLTKGNYDQAMEDLRQMGAGARGAFNDVREAIFSLRTTLTPDRGLVRILHDYAQEYSRNCGIPVELHAPQGQELHLPPETQVQLVRIVQEAMTNVRKHARASRVTVRLSNVDKAVAISVEDDGQGFEVETSNGKAQRRFGLSIMRERAEAAGAQFSLQSQPGRGTRVTVELLSGSSSRAS